MIFQAQLEMIMSTNRLSIKRKLTFTGDQKSTTKIIATKRSLPWRLESPL